MRGQGIKIRRALRRAVALFLTTLALWLLGLVCDLGAAAQRLGESPRFVAAALQAELGPVKGGEGAWESLDFWQRLAVGQSVLLRGAGDELDAWEQESETDEGAEVPPAQETGSVEDQAEQLPQSTTAPGDIVEQTLVPVDGEAYESAGGAYLYNYTSQDVDVQALASAEIEVDLSGEEGPQILIMHTHTTEAYTMDGTDIYTESDTSRTTDEHYNMLRIGDEMQKIFEQMGLRVVHDRTLYDYPQYSGAYTRSSEGIQTWLEQYPSIQVVLDVHRDALLGEDGTVYKPVTELNGEKTAQVMLVVGTDDQGQSHPYWQGNLSLALQIQQELVGIDPTLARPIALRSSRFNQQLTRGSLLVEVGSHGNTLQEALRAARYFAQAAGDVFLELT